LIQHTRKWGEQARPLPKHVKWVPYYEPGKYDLAILHVDQQCLSPRIAYGKSMVFREVKAQIKDIPIIVINHGTPVYPEVFTQFAQEAGLGNTEEAGEEWARREMKKLMEGVSVMVVNSHKAKEMWGFGKTIIHGLDPEDWWDLPKEPRVVTFISPGGIGEKYYGRRFFRETRQVLRRKYGVELVWIGQDKYCASWDDYRNFLGRSLVYFNPTIGSPMPRTRTEAMFSGCCVVTTPYQDADRFIKNGVNGFLVNVNPQEAAKVIADCIFNYQKSVEIGQKGKETAKKLFNGKRFRKDWFDLIKFVLKVK